MKHVPNIISVTRIILSVLLIFLLKDRWIFAAVFIICGFSDLLDGYIARKTKVKSTLGAKLDSIADFFMFGIITVAIVTWAGKKLTIFILYLLVVFLIRIANIIIAALKYHSFAIIHTWGNKVTGLAVFFTFVLFAFTDDMKVFPPVCILAVLSALEETLIHVTSGKLDLNRKSIFKP